MDNQAILVKNRNVIITSPIYNNLHKIKNLNLDNSILIINGNICYPYENIDEIEERIASLFEILNNDNCYYIVGNKDLLCFNENKESKLIKRLVNGRFSLTLKFKNETMITVLNGGISENMSTFDDLNNMEIAFITNWHEKYNGRFGNIISSKPHSNNTPNYFNFSISIDDLAYSTNNLSYLKYDCNGNHEYCII
mgnify:CR=1 FL=1